MKRNPSEILQDVRLAEMACRAPTYALLNKGGETFLAFGAVDANGKRHLGRKLHISRHACDQEIVGTALLAAKLWAEHEVPERFTYQGVAIASPHFNYDDLVLNVEQDMQRFQTRV